MEQQGSLTIETFLAVAEMIAAQLRIKEADRWTAHVCQLKFVSFLSEFPEVSDLQFLWAAEQWLQDTGARDFVRYPTWKQLMVPLYRSENGLANRSWGFRDSLPAMCRPGADQLRRLPTRPESICPGPDPQNAEAYVQFEAGPHRPMLPAAAEGSGLTPEQWAEHLLRLAEEDG